MNKVLDALRAFQLAHTAAFRRAADALQVSETDLAALQSLLSTDEHGLPMKDLAQEVGVSPAVLTGIVDRLEERGWIRRESNASDRRSTVVVPTVDSDSEVVRVLHALDDPLRKVANSLPLGTAAVVRRLTADMEAELRSFDPTSVLTH